MVLRVPPALAGTVALVVFYVTCGRWFPNIGNRDEYSNALTSYNNTLTLLFAKR
jgi:hypothetical protein